MFKFSILLRFEDISHVPNNTTLPSKGVSFFLYVYFKLHHMKAIKAFIRPKRLRFKALRFVGIIILRTWPKDDRSSYSIDFFWCFYLFNYLVILFLTISAIQKHKSDLVMTSYSWLGLSTILESSAILIYTKYQSQRLKV